MRRFLLPCVAALFLFPCNGEATEIKVSAGAMAVSSEYRATSARTYAMPLVSLEDEHFYIRGLGAGAYLWKSDACTLSLGVEYLPVHFKPKDSSNLAMKQLDKRYSTMLASASWECSGKEWGCLRLMVAADVLGKNDGFLADMAYSYPVNWGDMTFTPTLGVLWTSAEYNDYYYGVSKGESYRSGLSSYESGYGFSPYASMRVDFALNSHWGLYAIASAMVLSNEVHDSPMVDERVKYGIGGGVSYSF